MLGNLINFGTIIVGSIIGLLLKKGIKPQIAECISKALGIAVVIIGLNGVISNMASVDANGAFSTSGELLLLLSLVIGTFFGGLLKIDDRFNSLAQKLEEKHNVKGFANGFVTSTLMYCVGAMAILGGIQDGMGNPEVLITKSVLDGVNSIILASTLGVGVIFSSVVIFVYQGIFALLSYFGLQNVCPSQLLSEISFVGYAIIVCIGLNFLLKEKIKTANMLPSLLVPIAWYGIMQLVALIG